MNEDFLQSEDQSEDQSEHQSKHPDGHNVIIMSNAAKPIFCRWGNEEELGTACSLIQALLANTVEYGQLSTIRTKNKKQYVFLNVGSLTLVSIISNQGSNNVEGGSFLFQRMCLELIYTNIIFTLTNHVHKIFQMRPNFDLRAILGEETENMFRSILNNAGPFRTLTNRNNKVNLVCQPFFSSSVEVLYPIPFKIRNNISNIISVATNVKNIHVMFGILMVKGQKLVTFVQKIRQCDNQQPHKVDHHYCVHNSDLHLILNFFTCLPLQNECFLPICLPRLDSSGFVYAYHLCLDIKIEMRLILISNRNGDEEFGLLRNSAIDIRQKLGFEQLKDSIIYESKSHATTSLTMINSSPTNSGIDMKKCDVKEDTTLIHAIRLSLQPNVQEKMVKHYHQISSALHFVFLYNSPILTEQQQQQHYYQQKEENKSSAVFSQCLNPPITNSSNTLCKRRVWDNYQNLYLKLRLGSVSFESTMNAFDMMFASTKDRGAYKTEEVDTNCNCLSALTLLESPPFPFHGVTYILESTEMFMGLNGDDFELYVTLPATLLPKDGALLCAKLIRRIISDRKILFLEVPFTLQS